MIAIGSAIYVCIAGCFYYFSSKNAPIAQDVVVVDAHHEAEVIHLFSESEEIRKAA